MSGIREDAGCLCDKAALLCSALVSDKNRCVLLLESNEIIGNFLYYRLTGKRNVNCREEHGKN